MWAMPSSDEIAIRPLAAADRLAAGRIYARAFPELMTMMLRARADLGPLVMADLFDPTPNLWAAELDGTLAGVAWLQDELAPDGARIWPALRHYLPVCPAARGWFSSFLVHQVRLRPDLLYLDGLAVADTARGRGVGRELLTFVIDEARRRHKRAVGLYVLEGSGQARAMYLRRGFRPVRRERLRVLRRFSGFTCTTEYLELEIAELDVVRPGTPDADRAAHVRAADRISALLEHALWRREPPG
jgi:GNAT superfamily N-acetyltransferase